MLFLLLLVAVETILLVFTVTEPLAALSSLGGWVFGIGQSGQVPAVPFSSTQPLPAATTFAATTLAAAFAAVTSPVVKAGVTVYNGTLDLAIWTAPLQAHGLSIPRVLADNRPWTPPTSSAPVLEWFILLTVLALALLILVKQFRVADGDRQSSHPRWSSPSPPLFPTLDNMSSVITTSCDTFFPSDIWQEFRTLTITPTSSMDSILRDRAIAKSDDLRKQLVESHAKVAKAEANAQRAAEIADEMNEFAVDGLNRRDIAVKERNEAVAKMEETADKLKTANLMLTRLRDAADETAKKNEESTFQTLLAYRNELDEREKDEKTRHRDLELKHEKKIDKVVRLVLKERQDESADLLRQIAEANSHTTSKIHNLHILRLEFKAKEKELERAAAVNADLVRKLELATSEAARKVAIEETNALLKEALANKGAELSDVFREHNFAILRMQHAESEAVRIFDVEKENTQLKEELAIKSGAFNDAVTEYELLHTKLEHATSEAAREGTMQALVALAATDTQLKLELATSEAARSAAVKANARLTRKLKLATSEAAQQVALNATDAQLKIELATSEAARLAAVEANVELINKMELGFFAVQEAGREIQEQLATSEAALSNVVKANADLVSVLELAKSEVARLAALEATDTQLRQELATSEAARSAAVEANAELMRKLELATSDAARILAIEAANADLVRNLELATSEAARIVAADITNTQLVQELESSLKYRQQMEAHVQMLQTNQHSDSAKLVAELAEKDRLIKELEPLVHQRQQMEAHVQMLQTNQQSDSAKLAAELAEKDRLIKELEPLGHQRKYMEAQIRMLEANQQSDLAKIIAERAEKERIRMSLLAAEDMIDDKDKQLDSLMTRIRENGQMMSDQAHELAALQVALNQITEPRVVVDPSLLTADPRTLNAADAAAARAMQALARGLPAWPELPPAPGSVMSEEDPDPEPSSGPMQMDADPEAELEAQLNAEFDKMEAESEPAPPVEPARKRATGPRSNRSRGFGH